MAGGLKSELKRTEQSFAKQQEDEEDEEEDSSVIRTVGRNFLRFVYALVVFGVLLVGSAYVLWIYERPIEERAQLAEVEERSRWGSIIARLFKFIAVPNDEGLVGTDCATAYLDHPTIFPDFGLRTPGPERWVLETDNITTCDGASSDAGACRLTCVLKQPSSAQVQACRVDDPDDFNPALFDEACLTSSGSSCPNCHLLVAKLDDLRFSGPAGEDAAGKRNMQAAEIYQMYRTQLEGIESSTHWDVSGSLFFAFTVLTAVGYGSYAPVAFESKLAITVATIPGIVIFAYALGLFAGIVMNLVTHLKIEFGLARRRPGVSRRARVWARALQKCDADGDGELTLDELVRGADDICRLVGIDVGDGSAGRGYTKKKKGNTQNKSGGGIDDDDDTAEESGDDGTVGSRMTRDREKTPSNSLSTRAEAEARSFLRAAFEDADVDNSGSLTMMESMAMVSDLVRVRETQLQEAQSWEQLRAALFCIAPVVAAAAFGFQHFERAAGNEFGILDAFYFVIVSLTTVGLGDIVPSEGLSMIYWYVWMTVGLGLIALILSTAGVILASTSERVALTATKARKKRNGDGKKSKRTRIEPQPMRGYVEEDVDVERAFERKNSKWGKKSIDG